MLSHKTAQAGLEFGSFSPQATECLDYRCAPTRLLLHAPCPCVLEHPVRPTRGRPELRSRVALPGSAGSPVPPPRLARLEPSGAGASVQPPPRLGQAANERCSKASPAPRGEPLPLIGASPRSVPLSLAWGGGGAEEWSGSCSPPPRSSPVRASRSPQPAALPRDPTVLSRSRGAAMAKRSSLSIRIVEGKNLPAKDM